MPCYPVQGNKNTVAPGQYPFNSGSLNDVSSYTFGPIDISNFETGIYVILHAVTCESQVEKTVVTTTVKSYHKPYENTIDLAIDIPYDAVIDVRFMDMSGKTVMEKKVGASDFWKEHDTAQYSRLSHRSAYYVYKYRERSDQKEGVFS